jgi:RNA polymerase sigma-70 factor (ECF subfamily)
MQHPGSKSSNPPASSSGGDEAPLAWLYEAHAPAILAYLRLRVAVPEDVEDLLLEVFLAALERLDFLEYRSSERQRAWLRGVAAHKVADYYRRQGSRQEERLERVAATLYADEAHSPERLAMAREEYERLQTLLRGLPRLQQQVIHLRFVYGLRSAEIAQALGKKEEAVRKLLWRALTLVRTLYLDE